MGTTRTTIQDLIDAGQLNVGDKLTGSYHGHQVTATVTEAGKLRIARKHYPSPTTAAKAAIAAHTDHPPKAVNGWTFWRDAEGNPLDQSRQLVVA